MNIRHVPCRVTLLAAGLLVLASPICAAELIEDVQVGIAGNFKLGHWTAVQIRLQSPTDLQGRIDVTVPDGDATDAVYRGPSVSLSAGQPQTVFVYVRFGRQESGLEVLFHDLQGQQAVSRRFATARAMLSTDYWILTVGADIPLNDSLLRRGLAVDSDLQIGHLDSLDQLPDQWIGLDGVDQLVMTTSRQQYTGEAGESESRLGVLSRWIHMGGRMVISVGHRGEELLGPGALFSGLVPGTFSASIQKWQTGGLEDYAGATQRLLTSSADASPMTLLTDLTGVIETLDGVGGTGVRPMIVRGALGLGQVVFLAVDLDRPPIAGWSSYDRLLEAMLSQREDVVSSRASSAGSLQVAHVGYTDLVGQLRAALDRFAGVTIVSFYWVVGILVVYILLVGPFEYLLLKRYRREHWTWVTFPLLVALFAFIAVTMTRRLKSDKVLLNQLEIVDLDLTSQHVRSTSWLHLYSPHARTFDISLDSTPLSSLVKSDGQDWSQRLSWQGLPGSGLGGLNSQGGNVTSQPYEHGSAGSGKILGLPIMAASTRSLVGMADGNHQLVATSDLVPDSITETLQGTLSNPLSMAIEEGILYYGDYALELPKRLEPGETVRVEEFRETMRNVKSRLTRSSLSQRNQEGAGWSQVDVDVPRIVQMLMFHDAAGGSRYTQLTHRYQSRLDLSDHLNLRRALLVGRVSVGASTLMLGSEVVNPDQQWVYYRIIFPVSPAVGR